MTSKDRTGNLARGGIIAGLYLLLTLVSNSMGLASGMVQFRISEALCVLPVFTEAAVPGLFAGCLIANLLVGCAPWDIVCGSFATLFGAVLTRKLRNRKKLCLLPPVILNTLVIPPVLSAVYGMKEAWWILAASVFAGEFVSCYLLGGVLGKITAKHREQLKL